MKSSGLYVREVTVIITLVCLAVLFAPTANAQTTYTYPPFPSNAAGGLQTNGNAQILSNTNGNFLRVTPNVQDQVGSAWYTNPAGSTSTPPVQTLSLAGGFTTTFTFQLSSPSQNSLGSADGIVFVVQNGSFSPSGPGGIYAVAPSNGLGGQLGYTGLTNSVAVQFDSWYNGEYGDTQAVGGGPSSADEISVQSCGANANTSDHGGCTFGRIDLSRLTLWNGGPLWIADGNPHTATITYTAPTSTGSNCPPGSTPSTAGCGSLAITVDQQLVLTVPFSLSYLTGLDGAGDAYPGFTAATGGGDQNQDILSWSFAAAVVQPINTTTPPNLPANFSTPAGTIQTDIDYTTSTGITSPISNPVLLTINNTLSQVSTWPQYVAGTPWATSLCTIKAGNNGTDLCSLYVNECYDSTMGPGTATDANCPVVSDPSPSSFVTLKDTFDWSGGKVQPQPGTTISLIDFTPAAATPNEQWNPSSTSPNPVCTNVSWSTSNGAPTQCDISDTLVDVYGDQTTTRGSKPKAKGWLVSVYNVPMPTTTVQASPNPQNSACPLKSSVVLNNTSGTVWNNGACLLDFLVNSAQLPTGTTDANGFQAAPPATLLYGSGAPVVQPGPIPSGDVLVSNPNPVCTGTPCAPATWDTVLNGTVPSTSPTLSFLGGDGTHTLHWSAGDTVGITEKNIQLSNAVNNSCPTPDGPVSGSQCYSTSYFTTQVNIDSVPPQQNSCASPDGNWHNANVTLACSASDATSGIASATPSISGVTLPVPAPGLVNFGVSTNIGPGQETNNAFTGTQQLCDYASNCASFGNIGGNKVDEKAPVVTVSNPTSGASFAAYASAQSSVTCTDGGSGVANCNGATETGGSSVTVTAPLNTTPNGAGTTSKTFVVSGSVDEVGNIAPGFSVNYSVSCHYASVTLNSTTLTKGISFNPAATMLTDCVSATQKTIIELTLTGPFAKSCSASTPNSTQLLFLPLPVTIPAGTNKSPLKGVVLLVPSTACSGRNFTFTTSTYSTSGALLDSVSQAVTVK
ncbi:MAG: L-type lectin-domain containing protein [Candidatus Acidiferrum sp.]